jgi:hypothetical protein
MDHCKQQQLLKSAIVHTRLSLYEAQTALVSTSESQREAHTCSQASNAQLIIKASLALATDHYSQA